MLREMDNSATMTVMTLAGAARELGLAYRTVRSLLDEGKLKRAAVLGGEPLIFVDADSVYRLKRERALNPPRRGRPRKQTEEES